MKKMYLFAAIVLAASTLSAQNLREAFDKQREFRKTAIENLKAGKSVIDFNASAKALINKNHSAHKTSSSTARPDSIREYVFTGTQYDYVGYHKFIYFPNLKPLEVTTYYDQGGTHEPNYKFIYNYAAGGRIGQIEYFYFDNGAPVLDSRYQFTYDAQNRLTLQKLTFFDMNQNIVDVLTDSIIMTTNAQNQVTKYTVYSKMSINDPYEKSLELGDIVYDPTTNYEKEIAFYIDPLGSGFLVKFQEIKDLKWNFGYAPFLSLLYNPEMLAGSTHEFYDLYPQNYLSDMGPSDGLVNEGFPVLEPSMRITTTLQNGNVTTQLIELYDGSGWYNSERTLFAYTPQNQVKSLTDEDDFGMGWEPNSKTELTYDAENHISGEYELEYFNNTWDTLYGDLDIRQFDAQKRMIEMEDASFDPGIGVNPFGKYEFFYGANIGLNELAASTLQVYPNPATDRILIESNEPLNAQISLYDLSGRRVLGTVAKLMENASYELQVNALAKGTYLLMIQSNGSMISTQRVVLK